MGELSFKCFRGYCQLSAKYVTGCQKALAALDKLVIGYQIYQQPSDKVLTGFLAISPMANICERAANTFVRVY
jgi:hypothetical protein